MRRELAAYFLVGPTAVGKSAVAQWIAEQDDYEILSADSMLVYAGMDIGTAKPGNEERSRVRHHGLDLVRPDQPFSAGDYCRHAKEILRESAARGKRIIVAGGTGLYIQALIEGLEATGAPDRGVRAYWSDVLAREGVEALQKALKRKKPDLYSSLADTQNPRRLIRALEMTETGPDMPKRTWNTRAPGAALAGLTRSAESLNRRIEARVAEMYRAGLIEEVRGLLAACSTLSPTARQAIGYAEAIDVLEGRLSPGAAMEKTATRTRQLAKRQRTWFRHQAHVAWIGIETGMSVEEIGRQVKKVWSEHGPTKIAD